MKMKLIRMDDMDSWILKINKALLAPGSNYTRYVWLVKQGSYRLCSLENLINVRY